MVLSRPGQKKKSSSYAAWRFIPTSKATCSITALMVGGLHLEHGVKPFRLASLTVILIFDVRRYWQPARWYLWPVRVP